MLNMLKNETRFSECTEDVPKFLILARYLCNQLCNMLKSVARSDKFYVN